ncbi:Os04g0636550, partial [Oryza sativa Japonica Group]
RRRLLLLPPRRRPPAEPELPEQPTQRALGLPDPVDLLPHARALLLELHHPLPDVVHAHRRRRRRPHVVPGLVVVVVAILLLRRPRPEVQLAAPLRRVPAGGDGGALVDVVGDEEPPGHRGAQPELLEEEHLHHHPQRQPLVLRRVRARLQRQLLAVHQPAQLLPLRRPFAYLEVDVNGAVDAVVDGPCVVRDELGDALELGELDVGVRRDLREGPSTSWASSVISGEAANADVFAATNCSSIRCTQSTS